MGYLCGILVNVLQISELEARKMSDPMDEFWRILGETVPRASRVFLAGFVDLPEDAPAVELVSLALAELAGKGKIRGKKKTAASAVGVLLNEIPELEPQKAELARLYREAESRLA